MKSDSTVNYKTCPFSINIILPAMFFIASLSGVAIAEQSSSLQIEEIIVTAEKREQSIQDVPISMSALDEGTLEKYGIDELEDFEAKIPNVVINEFFGIATTFRSFVRGIGAVTVEVTQDPAVAVYTDGVYVGSSFGGSFESSDLERVEVLRGPQGTLYGRNATGGAINLITKKPELNNVAFKQSFSTGNLGKFKSNTSLNLPLGEKAAAKLGFLVSQRDGTVDNDGLGEDYGVEDRKAARLALRILPTDTFTIDFAAEYTTVEDTPRYAQVLSGASAAVAGTNTPINVPLGPPGAPTVDVFYTDPVTQDRLDNVVSPFEVLSDDNKILGTTLTLSWDVSDNATIKSVTGYRDVDARQYTQVTGTVQAFLNVPTVPFAIGPNTLGTGGIYELDFSQFSQELQLVGDTSLFGGDLEYATGVYYYDDEGANRDLSGSLAGLKATDTTDTENESIAVYGQASYTPAGSRFHFTVGARYTDDKRKAIRTNLNVTPPFQNVEYDKSFSNFSPSFTLAYDMNDDVNLYGKVVTGYRSGGTSVLSFNEALFRTGADEEEIISYELGMKGDFLERRLRLNAAVFYMDYQHYQASIQTGPTPADRDILNIGDNDIFGVELDLIALLSDQLSLSMSFGYLDTEINEDSVDPGTGAPPTPLIDVLPYAPKYSFSASLDYQRNVFTNQLLEWHINFSYQDESESGIVLGTSGINSEKHLLDMSLSLSNIPFYHGNIKMSLWAKNLTDDEYTVSNIGPFAFVGANEISPFGDPRTYGFTISYEYD